MSNITTARNTKRELLARIQNRTARIGVVGLGYVGLPLALNALRAGFPVTGFDIDPDKVRLLLNGGQYLKHIDHSPLSPAIAEKCFSATTDFNAVEDLDAIVICVPTPLGSHNEPDLSYITSTMSSIIGYLRPGQLISLESSTYPGTTEETICDAVAELGFRVGEDLFVVYSPEREDPGNSEYSSHTIPKVVGGMTAACAEVGVALYGSVVSRVVQVTSLRVAEMTKLLENIYRAVNIGLVNELKMVAERMDIDIWEVIDAAATKPFGFTPFRPGPGLGGHCIPIDPFYLTWKAREVGVHTRFIELAGEINSSMPRWVVQRATHALNDRGIALRGAKVLVLGVAYKKNIGDVRESPAVAIMELLKSRGCLVEYADPHVPEIPPMRKFDLDMRSLELSNLCYSDYDCVLIATDHDMFDYEKIEREARLVVDTRGRFRNHSANVVSA